MMRSSYDQPEDFFDAVLKEYVSITGAGGRLGAYKSLHIPKYTVSYRAIIMRNWGGCSLSGVRHEIYCHVAF